MKQELEAPSRVPGRPAPKRARRTPTLRHAPAPAPNWPVGIRAAVSWGLLLLVVLTLSATVGIWIAYGHLQTIHTPAEIITSLGQLTGMLAAYSLLLELLLMARLPFVELVAGFENQARWHKLNGKILFGLVLAHVGLIIWGYALTSHTSVITETVNIFNGMHDMVQAYIGTALLIIVFLTSIYIVRHRLNYQHWYLVHLLAYAALILAWFHQIPTSPLFFGHPLATAFWTALFIGTIEVVILFRLVQPVVRAWWHRLRVTEVRSEGPGVVSITMSGRRLEWFNAQAGQFFIWRFLAPGLWGEAHPFSLSAAPNGTAFRITTKAVGDYTSRLAALKPGTFVVSEGPFGTFTEEVQTKRKVAMIAGGIGITPIRALLETIEGNVIVIYRALNEADLTFRRELDELVAARGAYIHYVVGDHRDPANSDLMSAGHLRSLAPDISGRDVYLCGPPAMMTVLERTVKYLGVPRDHIHTDKFEI